MKTAFGVLFVANAFFGLLNLGTFVVDPNGWSVAGIAAGVIGAYFSYRGLQGEMT